MTKLMPVALVCALLAGCTARAPHVATSSPPASPSPSASASPSPSASASPAASTTPSVAATPPPIPRWSTLTTLPVATSRAVAFADAGSIVLAGGLGAGRSTTGTIWRYSLATASWTRDGTLAVPVHDAAAARIGTHAIVFGGGSASSSDVVQELRPGAQSVVIGHLPEVRSDANAVTIGARALIVGGYNGKAALRDVLETTDGATFRMFARLPIGVRYAAVTILGTTIYVFGGQTTSGADTDAVQTVDAAGNARILTHLRNTFAHAFAIANGTHILVGGGEHGNTTRTTTFSFDTRTARATSTPDAPFAIQDTAVSSKGDAAYIAGGEARSKNLRSFERITF